MRLWSRPLIVAGMGVVPQGPEEGPAAVPAGPEGTGGLRGAAPNKVRLPSLAGGRALRRPEHPWDHKPPRERAKLRTTKPPGPTGDRAAHASGR